MPFPCCLLDEYQNPSNTLAGCWLSLVLYIKELQVQLPVRVYAWIAGSIPDVGAYERQLIDIFLLYQCLSLSKSNEKISLGEGEGPPPMTAEWAPPTSVPSQ